MNAPRNLTAEIVREIAYAIRKLGGKPETVDLTDTWQVNRTLDFLGADIHLLATVGSWKDTLPDDVMLGELRAWNTGKSLATGTLFRALRQVKSKYNRRQSSSVTRGLCSRSPDTTRMILPDGSPISGAATPVGIAGRSAAVECSGRNVMRHRGGKVGITLISSR